ncbi:ABC transporter ATP-binding protein [Rhodobacteraceae bacterium NNCM2]|nr:ABC transporter ATP-binding protein [Coraliihabitans acroporae]
MNNLTVGYGGRPVLDDFSIALRKNEILCLLGHNGAGKSTLLKSVFGLLKPKNGTLKLKGDVIEEPTPHKLTEAGVSMLPEGKGVFPSLTVRENMKLGFTAADIPPDQHRKRLDWVMDIFPAIQEFTERPASTLSGGQQQMVSLARTLLSRPQCLLLDEPSIGLAPQLFQSMLVPIRRLQEEYGMSILMVEQNVRDALTISDRVMVMKSGAIVAEGPPEEFKDNTKLMEYY